MKQRRGVFDDLNLDDDYPGPPVYYPNQNIRRMLNLAQATEKDIFCDLGSGFGQNIVISLGVRFDFFHNTSDPHLR